MIINQTFYEVAESVIVDVSKTVPASPMSMVKDLLPESPGLTLKLQYISDVKLSHELVVSPVNAPPDPDKLYART